MKGRTASFSLSPVHPDTVKQIICQLKNSKASGIDNIDTYVIKLIADEIVPVITHIVNLSIQEASFPKSYKIAKVIPLFKKGDPLEAKNYRPVALLCIISKIIERAIFLQIVDFMCKNNLMHPNHHGFRANHSTATAMIHMYDSWVQAAERKEVSGVCMLDMSAAFDVVDHGILLGKLKLYGFDDNTVAWVKDYLTGRSQTVYLDGAFSSKKVVNAGVPQGSILGPLFYLIFTNEFPETVFQCDALNHEMGYATQCQDCGGLCCFADDSTYSVSSENIQNLSQKLTSRYEIMAQFLSNNKLKLNQEKTQFLVMATNQRRKAKDISVEIRTNNETIKPVKTAKLLGVEIQDDLKWSQYILLSDNSLVRQLTSRLSAIKLVCGAASFKERLMMTNGLFCSKLIYQICLWGGAEDYLLQSLQKVQNRAVRFVAKSRENPSLSLMFRSCGWLNVRQLVFYHSNVLIHKVLLTSQPQYIHERLPTEFTCNTRLAASNSLRVALTKRANLSLTGNSFINRSIKSYNLIPAELRQLTSLTTFKSKLKIWVAENYKSVYN